MSLTELGNIKESFLPYKGNGDRMNMFFNKESGQVIVIIYDPNIIGLTRLKDILTLSTEELRNVRLYFKTRNASELENVLLIFNQKKNVQELHELREN